MKRYLSIFLISLLALFFVASCADAGPPPSDEAVPPGDPPFPVFEGSWVIDTTGSIPQETIQRANVVLEGLRKDGIAEVVIVVINGVSHPELYATRLGRHLKVGNTKTDNGIVYLVLPDAAKDQHLIYSLGRGLTAFTSDRVTDALKDATVLANEGDFSGTVLSMAVGTESVLRQYYQSRPETVTTDGEDSSGQLTPDQRTALVSLIVGIVIWVVIGIVLMFIDVDLGVQWLLLGLRILLLIATAGKAGGGTGGSGKFGGRSGSR